MTQSRRMGDTYRRAWISALAAASTCDKSCVTVMDPSRADFAEPMASLFCRIVKTASACA